MSSEEWASANRASTEGEGLARLGTHPGCHSPHARVVEQPDQAPEPPLADRAVAVHEGHQRGVDDRHGLVAGGGRTPLTSRLISRAPWRRHTAAMAPGSSEASSTTTTGPPGPSDGRHRSRASLRSCTGTTTVRLGTGRPPRRPGPGWAMPASTSRRPAGLCRPTPFRRPAGTQDRCAVGAQRDQPPGWPPTRTVPRRRCAPTGRGPAGTPTAGRVTARGRRPPG